jgi:hypothetical protein
MAEQTEQVRTMVEKLFSDWLTDYCNDHIDPFVKSSEDMVRHCLDIDDEIPNEYGWKFSSKDALEKQLSKATGNGQINKIFWEDQARNIEAYSMMTLWRGIELITSCLRSMNNKEVIAPAIAARSLLELSTVFLLNANTLQKTFGDLTFPEGVIVTSTEVEALVVKMIWGTRYDNPEPHVLQTNIMTSLQRLAKNSNANKLMPIYEYLCDIAHPSFIGNTSYWSHIESVDADGAEKRVISRLPTRQINSEILEKTIWALAWSSVCIRNAFDIMREANMTLIRKLGSS